jgi:hypothetical protein
VGRVCRARARAGGGRSGLRTRPALPAERWVCGSGLGGRFAGGFGEDGVACGAQTGTVAGAEFFRDGFHEAVEFPDAVLAGGVTLGGGSFQRPQYGRCTNK